MNGYASLPISPRFLRVLSRELFISIRQSATALLRAFLTGGVVALVILLTSGPSRYDVEKTNNKTKLKLAVSRELIPIQQYQTHHFHQLKPLTLTPDVSSIHQTPAGPIANDDLLNGMYYREFEDSTIETSSINDFYSLKHVIGLSGYIPPPLQLRYISLHIPAKQQFDFNIIKHSINKRYHL